MPWFFIHPVYFLCGFGCLDPLFIHFPSSHPQQTTYPSSSTHPYPPTKPSSIYFFAFWVWLPPFTRSLIHIWSHTHTHPLTHSPSWFPHLPHAHFHSSGYSLTHPFAHPLTHLPCFIYSPRQPSFTVLATLRSCLLYCVEVDVWCPFVLPVAYLHHWTKYKVSLIHSLTHPLAHPSLTQPPIFANLFVTHSLTQSTNYPYLPTYFSFAHPHLATLTQSPNHLLIHILTDIHFIHSLLLIHSSTHTHLPTHTHSVTPTHPANRPDT